MLYTLVHELMKVKNGEGIVLESKENGEVLVRGYGNVSKILNPEKVVDLSCVKLVGRE